MLIAILFGQLAVGCSVLSRGPQDSINTQSNPIDAWTVNNNEKVNIENGYANNSAEVKEEFLNIDNLYSELGASYVDMEPILSNRLTPQMFLQYQQGLKLKIEKTKSIVYGKKYKPLKILSYQSIANRKSLVNKDWTWSHDLAKIKEFYSLFKYPGTTIEYKAAFFPGKAGEMTLDEKEIKVSKVSNPVIIYLYKSEINDKLILIDPFIFTRYAL